MNFSTLLVHYRKEKNISQRDMVGILSSQSRLLSSLDSVTLSRWERGITIPSMEKRFLILSIIDRMDEYFIAESEQYDSVSDNLLYQVLGKRYNKVTKSVTIFKIGQTQQDYQLNFSLLHNAPNEIQAFFVNNHMFVGQVCDQINAPLGYWKNNNKILGFFIHVPIKGKMLSVLSGHIDNMMNLIEIESSQHDALFLLDQINLTQECFELSYLRLFLLLLANPQFKQLYLYTHDQIYLNLMLRLGAEIVCTYQTEEMKENGMEHSQLVVFDSLKLISNKSVFEFFANVYNKLNRNSPELLKQLRESIK